MVEGVDWLSVFANSLSEFTSVNGGVLTSLGFALLSVTALVQLVNMVVQWNTASMSFTLHARPLQAGDVVKFLMRLVICCMLLTYWSQPLPGIGVGFNRLFSYLAQIMAQSFDQNSLNNFTTLLNSAGSQTPEPSLSAPLHILAYWIVESVVGVTSAILFLINISAYILYGVSALFGPIFIPLYMTQTFKGKFLNFIDVLIGFAMIRAVAAAFIFIWAGFMTEFFTRTFHGDYSLEMWIAHFTLSITFFVAFILNMLFIPSLTQAIFGGAAGMAGRAEQVGQQLITMAAAL